MTPRERLLSLLHCEQPDQVPWFGDLDYLATALIAKRIKPEDFKASPAYLEWHREMRVGYYLQGYFPFRAIYDLEERAWNEGNRRFHELVTPLGNLRECWEYLPDSYAEAPVEHLVKSEVDLPALRYVYEHTTVEPDYAFAYRRQEQIGQQGVLLCYLPKSPFMQLVALEAGITTVAFIENSVPAELEETIAVMKSLFDTAARIAVDSPAEMLMIPENLSSEMVGPRYFDRYMRGYQEQWASEIKMAGKISFVHMDGTLRGLLGKQASTGIRVIEAMTPWPVGDLAVEEWSTSAGNSDTILWGGIPGSYFTPHVSEEEFERHVRQVLNVMRIIPEICPRRCRSGSTRRTGIPGAARC